jgi:hypothetical protein
VVQSLDGAYVELDDDELEFRVDSGPTHDDIADLDHNGLAPFGATPWHSARTAPFRGGLPQEDEVQRRFSRWLERHGYLDEDAQDEAPLDGWFGPAAHDTVHGARPPGRRRDPNRFQVHASVRVDAGDRRGREQLCTYVARPPLAESQLEILEDDRVRLWLRNGRRGPSSSIVLTPMQL